MTLGFFRISNHRYIALISPLYRGIVKSKVTSFCYITKRIQSTWMLHLTFFWTYIRRCGKRKFSKKKFSRGFNASFSTTHYWWGNISKVFDHQSIFDGIFLLYHLYCARKLWKTSQNVRMKSNLILARFLVSAKK